MKRTMSARPVFVITDKGYHNQINSDEKFNGEVFNIYLT